MLGLRLHQQDDVFSASQNCLLFDLIRDKKQTLDFYRRRVKNQKIWGGCGSQRGVDLKSDSHGSA